jgi:DNA-binding winged helix-turn-helix (wHTH) protein
LGSSFHVGDWLVEPEQSRVVRGSESKRLDAKAIAVLSFLARHPNSVVTKEDLIAAVWDGAFVSDEVLTTAIWGLRKALGDDAKEPRYIQTIPRRGYRLIAPVERAAGEPSGKWEPSPYPGLSAFSQRDAAYFLVGRRRSRRSGRSSRSGLSSASSVPRARGRALFFVPASFRRAPTVGGSGCVSHGTTRLGGSKGSMPGGRSTPKLSSWWISSRSSSR